ncbi:MAG: TldD/PmbA family protein [Planctomycetota bacterium]|jgi:predicted Zn-dependent protease
MDRAQAMEVVRKAVSLSKSDDVVARLSEWSQGATRFANNVITQNVSDRRARLTVRVAFGKRRGEVVVNRFDDTTLADAVKRAEAIAEVTPEDDEHLPPVEPSEYAEVPAGDEATIELDPASRAEAVGGGIAAASGDARRTAGALTTGGGFTAFANSRGAEGYHTMSDAHVHATVMTGTSSGWAEEVNRRGAEVDTVRAASQAAERAKLAEDPREIEPGEYQVLLAPPALCELLAFLMMSADAKAADEGRSAFAGKEGTRIGSDKVTVRSVLDDPDTPGLPYDQEGVPHRDVTWIENGTLTSLVTTRYWAQHTDRPHTPYPGTFSVEGTDVSTEELLSRIDRGLYITRFWYTRFVDPMALLLTGMTRDALFLIEDGKIVSGVKHLRYNDSVLRILENVVEVGKPEPAWWYLRGRMPPVLVKSFRFTSGTTF